MFSEHGLLHDPRGAQAFLLAERAAKTDSEGAVVFCAGHGRQLLAFVQSHHRHGEPEASSCESIWLVVVVSLASLVVMPSVEMHLSALLS